MKQNEVTIDRWRYEPPHSEPDPNGDLALLRKTSLAPAELWEWGVRADGQPYERYRWCEDDFFADSSYDQLITKDALIGQLQSAAAACEAHGFFAAGAAYRAAAARLDTP
ncbi:MAG: hypothetical protein IKN53_05325 [Oscillibacter sp.]|nr:hypothetical protein [Oscillibacter sp.]